MLVGKELRQLVDLTVVGRQVQIMGEEDLAPLIFELPLMLCLIEYLWQEEVVAAIWNVLPSREMEGVGGTHLAAMGNPAF